MYCQKRNHRLLGGSILSQLGGELRLVVQKGGGNDALERLRPPVISHPLMQASVLHKSTKINGVIISAEAGTEHRKLEKQIDAFILPNPKPGRRGKEKAHSYVVSLRWLGSEVCEKDQTGLYLDDSPSRKGGGGFPWGGG